MWYPLREFIPRSAEALTNLERHGKKVTFVTNNSIISVKDHIEKFSKQGQLLVHEVSISNKIIIISSPRKVKSMNIYVKWY